MKAPMRQVELAYGPSRLVTWLPDDRRVRVGTRLTLKGANPVHLWEVIWRGDTTLPKSSLRQDWNVGGL